MIRAILFITFVLLISTSSYAQTLWGGLAPGPHAVGFKSFHERDNSRNGRPMTVGVWYPAAPSAKAKPVLFKDYLAAKLPDPTDASKKEAYENFRKIFEYPFIAGVNLTDEQYNPILEMPTAAKWNLPEAKGKFPVVLMSSEPESLSVSAEFLASNGFVVAVVDGPNRATQPPDSLLWVEPTEDMQWLQNYALKLRNVDPSKITVMGFGGGIQGAYFLSMQSNLVKAIVNLEGGVFGPRSLTDNATIYHPENIKAPMLHIITPFQQIEDDPDQVEDLVNASLYRAFIKNEGLRHHDFSIFGRVTNKGLKLRGELSDVADKTYVAVHKAILEFLKSAVDGKTGSFTVDERFMPYFSLEKFRAFAGLVLHQPAMDEVKVELGRRFYSGQDTTLVFDLYSPKDFDKKSQLPVIVFVNGVGSMDLHRWKIYRDWAKLAAANGMIGVTYQTRNNHARDDSERLLAYLAGHAAELGIDKEKMGVWACSANVGTGLPLAMDESRRFIKALAVYYGMAQPPPNTPAWYRQDVEIQIVRAGLDFYTLNMGIESFVKAALVQDLHFEYVNYPEGQHAFDAFDNTPRSKEIILQTIDFFKRTLSKDHAAPDEDVLTNSRLWAMIMGDKVDQALLQVKEAVAMYRKMPGHSPWYNHVMDERNLNQAGYQLLQAGKTNEALKVFNANQELFPESANVYDALGDAYEKTGDEVRAVYNSKKALEKLAKQTDIRPQQRDAIRKSAEEKIKRLQ
ncbi:MAG TPA: hypothetical protein VFE50_15840 [Cyclobacteriaceae bacterium]|nr:hypothetical protein [Cyclobacteriaceae bacterium]